MKNFYRLLNNMDREVILTEYDFSFMKKDYVVYQFYNSINELLYVGMTKNFTNRINKHRNKKEWYREISNIYISEPLTKNEAHIYEIFYISRFKPKYNNHFVNGTDVDFEITPIKFIRYDSKN